MQDKRWLLEAHFKPNGRKSIQICVYSNWFSISHPDKTFITKFGDINECSKSLYDAVLHWSACPNSFEKGIGSLIFETYVPCFSNGWIKQKIWKRGSRLEFEGLKPKSCAFTDLDFSCSEAAAFEITWSFDKMRRINEQKV